MKPIIIPPAEGNAVSAFGDTIVFKLVGSQTGQGITIGRCTTAPGGGPPLHIHQREDEIFIIESGDIEVSTGENVWQKVAPGSVVYLPKGHQHQFRNAGDTPAHFWLIASPSGFEDFYERCSAIFNAGGPPDFGKILQVAGEHGMQIVGPPPGGR